MAGGQWLRGSVCDGDGWGRLAGAGVVAGRAFGAHALTPELERGARGRGGEVGG